MDPERGVPRQRVEVGVGVEDGDCSSDGYRGDEAVDQPPDRLAVAPTGPVKRGRVLVVGGGRGQQRGPGEEPAELIEVLLVACPGQDLHAYRSAGGDVGFEERVDGEAWLRPGSGQRADRAPLPSVE